MRLTLRTLLAYLDKTLSPVERNVLDEKIKQAKVANALVERIGSVVTDASLPPMRIDAQGTAGDANTVAEYLDNTLDPNIVVDFEQAVLSDNTRLAEVAACHQILSSLVAAPESVAPTTKQALKDAIRKRFESNPNASVVDEEIVPPTKLADSDRIMESPGFVSQSYQEKSVRGIDLSAASEGQVPNYLKSHHSSGWGSLISTAALVAAVFALAWISLGSFESVQELLGLQIKLAKVDGDEPLVNTDETKLPEGKALAASDSDALPSNTAVKDEADLIPHTESNGSNTVGSAPNELPISIAETPSDSIASSVTTTDAKRSEEPITGEALNSVASADGTPMPSPSISDLPKELHSEPELLWRPETKSASEAFVIALKPEEAGQARLQLVTAGDSQPSGDRWLTPTGCRTDCWIAPGIRWKIADFSDLTIDKVLVNDAVVVQLRLGRALVASTPDCQTFNLETADGKMRNIHFNDPNGIVAVEVRYQNVPGAAVAEYLENDQNLLGMMNPVVTLTGVVGEATVSEDNITVEPLGVGETITWFGADPLVRGTLKSMPWWFKNSAPLPADVATTENMQQLLVEWKASNEAIVKTLPNQKPAVKGTDKAKIPLLSFLRDLAAKRSSSTHSLAMQLLLLSGDYSQVAGTAGVLSDPALKSQRATLLDTLEQSLGADHNREAVLKEQLEEIDPARASRILQLLSTPSEDQLERGVDRILVDAIASPFLDERVLGIHQLVRITGRDLGYQADRPTPDSVQAWKKLLNANKIRWPKVKNQ